MKAKRRIPTQVIELDYLKPVNQFLAECKEIETSTNKYGAFLASKHEQLFPGKKVAGMLCLLKSKIANRLQYVAMKSAGIKMTDKFLQTYEASQRMDPSLYTEDSKFYIEQAIKKEKDNMGVMKRLSMEKGTKTISKGDVVVAAKKGTVTAPKEKAVTSKKESTRNVFVELFSKNVSARLKDKQIIDLVNKRTGKNYEEKMVKGYRAGYNRGTLGNEKPKVPSVSY